MYGQGNYAPQFGQSPNRPPRPPFMQQQVGSAPTGLIQQGPPVSPHGVAQPVAQQLHGISPFGSTYSSAPMTQSNMSTSTSTGQCYPPQATTGLNSTTGTQHFLSTQQSAHTAQYFSPLLPPSSHSMVPPPPPQNQNLNRHPIHQPLPSLQQISVPHSALQLLPPPPMLPLQTSSVPPLPPSPPPFRPPPPSSSTLQPSLPVSKTINSDHVQSDCDPCFSQAVTPESEQNIVTPDTNRARDLNDASVEGGLSSMPSDTPPPRPTNEKTLRNIEILCQYISQNGPAFEDMARQKESGNPAFQFLFGGEPGSEAATEREYYLWMKNKLCPGQNKNNLLLKDKHEENSSSSEPNKEASNPVTDSDMDMEDDIIQPCESGLKHEFDSSVDEIEKGNQNNLLESLQGSISTTYEEPAIDLGGDDEGRSNITACTKTQTEDPFKLLKDYSSDESSEVDASEPVSTLQFHEAIVVASDQCKAQDIDASLAHHIVANELISVPSSRENKSDIAVENNVRANSSKQSDFHDLEEMDALESTGVGLVSDIGKDQREPTKSSASLRVDEFGRLIREGASGTDSDDSRRYRRRGRRGRSRSPSRSPPKRRRRRSPRRRKERRSLSQSWSPKRRRSRSRSPLRRPIDSGSQKNARGRQQTGECFNFLKGRCYRGASCKYLHSDSGKYGESRQYRSKHHASETRTSSRDYDHSEENKVTTRKGSPDKGSDKVKDGDLMANEKEHAGCVYASKISIVDEKHRDKDVSGLFNSNLQKDKKPEQTMSRGNDEYEGHSQAESLNQASQISTVSSCLPSEAMVSPCKNSVKIAGLKDLSSLNSTAFNYPNPVSHPQQPLCLPLLPPPPPPPLHAETMSRIPQAIQDYSSGPAQPNIPFPNQHTQFHPPQNMPWGNFPLQRPPYMLTPPVHSGPASFQQGGLPVRFDPLMQSSLNTNPADLPNHPQVGNLQDTSMSMQGSDQPPRHVDSTHPGNHLCQPVAGSLDPTSDDPRINSLSSGTFPSSLLPHGNIPPLPTSLLGEANPNRVQYLAHGNLPSGEPSSSGFQNPPYFQPQQQPYRFYQAAGDNTRDPLHFSADLHKNNLSQITDTGSRITAHYNPYASTFDQHLGSKFKYDAFRQGNKTENSNNLSSAPFEGQNVAYEASPVIPSPHSSKAGYQTLARSGEHQYDPLFDSIEPSAESLKKQVEQKDRAADNSDIMLRLSGSIKGKKKVLGADSAATSSETDEFGETAHPEVIAVEAGSQSNLNDSAEGSAGDVEINQVKREGKSKKSNDSRSMKLLKLALASFVKDMLKPSWRQGNMSKEAFKTIVKKTVEKVSGAMKEHRVPKSKEKIDQYIDRSQRKLTALVEGYVNKYAK